MPTPTAAERLHAQQQQIRKDANLPDPSQYQKMAAQKQKEIDDMEKDQEKENDPNRGRFSSGPSKSVIGTQPLVKSEAVTVGRVGGRGNIHMYDRNPPAKDGSELENVPFHAKTEKQKKLQNALTDLGKKMKEIHPKLREAKDSHEYDYEGEMAVNQLKTLMRHAEYLIDMMKPDTNLPEWVQSKITLAADYIQTSCDYMTSEMNEGNNFITVFKKGTNMKQKINPNSYAAFKHHGFRKEEVEELDESHKVGDSVIVNSKFFGKQKGKVVKVDKQSVHVQRNGKKYSEKYPHNSIMKEEVEQIDEISAELKASYKSKAKDQIRQARPFTKKGHSEYRDIAKNFIARRQKGIAKANEEVVQEGRPSQRHPLEGHEYHKKSDEALIHIAKDAHAAAEAMKSHNPQAENKYRDQANDSATVRHFRKTSGMPDWYKKKYGHVNEDVEQLQEYESKGGSYKNKGSYGYQGKGKEHGVSDSGIDRDYNKEKGREIYTVGSKLNKARTTELEKGMGIKMNRAELSKLQSKKTLMNVHKNLPEAVVPFDKPYKQDTGTTTDKSGAKHTPMSKVRNLARQAMKKAADRKLQKEAEEPATEPFVKNSKQMSRKAQIVKGAAKGNGDAFQKEPVLSASVEKNQSTN